MFFSVDGIAKNGGGEVVKVDADLVGAAGVEVAEDEGSFGGVIRGEDLVIGDSSFASWGGDDGHFLTIYGVAADVSEDGIGGFRRDAMGDCEVEFFHGFALGKLGGEALMGFI